MTRQLQKIYGASDMKNFGHRKNKKQRRDARAAVPARMELLEVRLVLSASFDLTGLTQLRSDPNFSSITGSGVTVAVLDTGIDAQNPDFNNKVLAYYNAVENPLPTSINSSSVASAVDNDGHGTHVSGIAASANPDIGVAYGADLVDVKVIPDSGEKQLSGDPLLRGLEFVEDFATQFNIKVVNMSLGESTSTGGINQNSIPPADDISRAIQTLESEGITVVAAAGNSYANDPAPGESYPADVSTISVANVWADNGPGYDFDTYSYGTPYDSWAAVESSAAGDQFSATSQRSTLVNQVAAPGMNIYSDWNGSSTDNSGSDLLHNTLSGTSMAAPFVSGLVALMQQAAFVYGGNYITSPAEVLSIIKDTSDVIPDPTIAGDGRVPIQNGQLVSNQISPLPGTGDSYDRVDVYKAIQAVKALFTGQTSNADTNDTITSATVVTPLNGTQSFNEGGNIGTDGLNQVGANDVDLYQVTLDETGVLTAALADANGGTAFTASLRLFDSNGNQIAIATGNSSGGYPTLTSNTNAPLPSGTYYVGVSSAGNQSYNIADGSNATGGSSTGDYVLTLSMSNPDPNGVPQGAVAVDLTDPNFVFSDDTVGNHYLGDLGSDPAPDGSSNRVPVAADVDMFKIIAPDTGLITADVDVSDFGFQGADSYVEALDSNLNLITANGKLSNFPSASAIQFQATIGQTYYVAVTDASNKGFDPTNPYGRPGSTPVDTGYDLYLSFDNGNSDGTALLARQGYIGTSVNGAISSTNAQMGANAGYKYVDWYTYTANGNGLIDLNATSTTTGFTPNVQLWTLTSDGTSITQIGAITGSGAHLIDQVFPGETVYVSVTGAGNSNFNWYSLASGSGGQTGTYTLQSALDPLSQLKTLNDSSVNGGTPQTISDGQTVTGNIGQYNGLIVGDTDVDLYKFVPSESGFYDIRTDTTQEGSADTVLRVFDVSGNQLAINDNASSATTASFLRVSLIAGQTYYIGVSGSGNSTYNPITGNGATDGSTGTYVLAVSSANESALTLSGPASVREPQPGTTVPVTFTVSLDIPPTNTVTVNYATANGSALAGVDYTTASGTLTFAPGQSSQTITVQILSDVQSTSNKTFTLNLSNPVNAIVGTGSVAVQITGLSTTTLPFSSKTPASYTDAAGHKIFVRLAGPGDGKIIFFGSDQNPDQITLDGTTSRSSLLVDAAGHQTTTLGEIQVTGSLGSISAGGATLTGDVTVTGDLKKITIAGTSGAVMLTVQGTGVVSSLSLGSASGLSIMATGAIANLRADSFTGGTVNSSSIKNLRVNGNFSEQLVLSDTGVALNTAIFGSLLAGSPWNIAGSARRISTGSIAPGFAANIGGAIGNLSVKSNLAGNLTADSIANLKIGGDLSSASVNLTGSGADLRRVAVRNSISNSSIRSAGDIGSVRAGALLNSSIYAGVAPGLTGLPASATDFAVDPSIFSVTITHEKTQPFAVQNSDIAAAVLGKITFGTVQIDNAGTPFGLAADQLASFTRIVNGHKVTSKHPQTSNDVPSSGDLTTRIFG